MDGSIVLTRKEGWKEMKLVGLFPASAHLTPSPTGKAITTSEHVAHLGGKETFFNELIALLNWTES